MKRLNTRYKKLNVLNDDNSPSTGSIVCYDGCVTYDDDGDFSNQFIEISDCYHKVRLHRAQFDDVSDWLNKIDALIMSLQEYRCHIVQNQSDIQKEIDRTRKKVEE